MFWHSHAAYVQANEEQKQWVEPFLYYILPGLAICCQKLFGPSDFHVALLGLLSRDFCSLRASHSESGRDGSDAVDDGNPA